jgi:hypothetical protein
MSCHEIRIVYPTGFYSWQQQEKMFLTLTVIAIATGKGSALLRPVNMIAWVINSIYRREKSYCHVVYVTVDRVYIGE